MSWIFAVPLMFGGFLVHAALTAPDGDTLLHHMVHAAGLTMATAGALVVLS
jgi:hypothetical protein